MTQNSQVLEARKELLINKNPEKALDILDSAEDKKCEFYKNTLGLALLESGQYKEAAELFKELGENYHAGFCELLMGNEQAAKGLWDKSADSAPCRWGKGLLDFIKGRTGSIPTYLQIRNHLENDIGYFIQANQIRYAENLMKSDDIFITVNLETYKLIGRVLLNFGFLNMAHKYFLKSKDLIPEDPETYYYLGQYHYQSGQHKDSKTYFEKCLELNKNHTPSKKMLGKVQLKLG